MRVLVAGGTGMVGSELLRQLASDPSVDSVVHLARREVPSAASIRTLVVDFATLASLELEADVAYCALGTTIAKAGSQDAFFRVDHDAVLAFAELALRAGVKTFVLVSSLGANADSRVFYSRTKGLVERGLEQLGFEHLVTLRPSILDGERQESRPGEAVALAAMRVLGPLMRGPLRRYRASRAGDVASAMRALVRAPGAKVRVVEAEEITALAERA